MDTNDTDYLDYLISLGDDEDPDDDYDPYELNTPFRVLLVGGPTRRQPSSSQELILTHGVFCGTERLVPGTNRVAPAYVMVTYFKNMEEIDRYIIEIESIRSNWVSFVETYDHLHPMPPVVMGRCNLHQHEWKLQVESFISDWGRDMVPHDMRWAYSGTGPLSLSDWPRNEDVDQATFDEVRNFLNERE